jgi:7,8-dihydroneopterin aldolase/epimerase/oxygenase
VRTRQSVTLQGMRFHARIGVLAHEATLPQPLEIDLTVWRRAGRGPGVIDYSMLYALVEGAVGAEHTQYLEELAERIAAAGMGVAEVAGLRVAVRKPHVLLPGPLGYAEVVLERERDG